MDEYEFQNKIIELVKSENIEEAIHLTESELLKIPKNDFHKIISRNLLHLIDDTDNYLTLLYTKSKKEVKELKSFFCEMNGFTINTDLWYVSGMSLSFCKDLADPDWLADYDFFFEKALAITGFEELQNVYDDYLVNEKWDLEWSADLCETIITLRLLELFRETYKKFKNKSEWTNIPVFVTSHDSELIFKTK